MYSFLVKYVGKKAANWLIILWYVLLILLVYNFFNVREGEMRYLDF